MGTADVSLVETWLRDPEVARWYLAVTTIEDELDDLRMCVSGDEQTEVLIAAGPGGPIGWCQWYLCDDYPDHAAGVGASPGDAGIDYAIGAPGSRGRGAGTALIAALVAYIRQRHPDAGVVADPEAANVASRRVLEKNGFELLAERPVASEPTSAPMAIYRLPPRPAVGRADSEDAGTHRPATTRPHP
jgi:aminoglycoside 6'-N-acetyltransferase